MRLEPVIIDHESSVEKLLEFYMGKNTPNRQEFIIKNLRVEKDMVDADQEEIQLSETE